jgi:alpha-beta hydrolase superfamily lysophospholipase
MQRPHWGPMPQPEPERFQFTSADGLSIACMKWGGHQNIRAVIKIAHGLGEHMGRYAELAQTLVHGEFVVYGNDHRGHGLTAKPAGNFGDFGSGGFDQLVEDMASLGAIAKHQHPADHVFSWATAWALSPRSSLSSTTVIQSTAWRFRAPALWTAWFTSPNRYPRERIR